MTPEKIAVARQLYDSRTYTVAAIAQSLGVSRASVYRHVGHAQPASERARSGAKEIPGSEDGGP